MGILKSQIGRLAVDGLAVTFGTANSCYLCCDATNRDDDDGDYKVYIMTISEKVEMRKIQKHWHLESTQKVQTSGKAGYRTSHNATLSTDEWRHLVNTHENICVHLLLTPYFAMLI